MNDKMLKSLFVFKIGMKKIMTSSAQNAAIVNTILASNISKVTLPKDWLFWHAWTTSFVPERRKPKSTKICM